MERRSLVVPSLAEAMAEAVRERILAGEIPGGRAVSEVELAREYEVARPTAKAAVELLIAAGLLRRSRHKSARVPEMDQSDVRDVYLARSYLESMAARSLSTSGTPPRLAQMSITRLAEMNEVTPVAELVEVDIEFHRSLVDAVDSRRISQMHKVIMGEIRLSTAQVQAHHLMERDVIVREHQEILDRIVDREPGAAVAASLSHLEHACSALMQYLERDEKGRKPG